MPARCIIAVTAGDLLTATAVALEGVGTTAKMLRICVRDLSTAATGNNDCNDRKLPPQVQRDMQHLHVRCIDSI